MRTALLAAVLAAGCAAVRRGADDGVVVATVPIHAVSTPATLFAEGWRKDPLSATASAPILVPFWIAGDLFFTGVSAADLALLPTWIRSEDRGPRLFDLDRFPPRLKREVATEAGQAATAGAAFLAPFAAFALAFSGRGQWNPPPGTVGPYPPLR